MMCEVKIVKVKDEHVHQIYDNVRETDRVEMEALGMSVKEALELGRDWSRWTKMVFFDNKPACMFGVSEAHRELSIGVPWMLGTEALNDHPRSLLLYSRLFISQMARQYALLMNHVHDENEPAKRYLDWLGFDLHEPKPYGPFDAPFRRFEMRK